MGNKAYTAGNFEEALEMYSKAIEYEQSEPAFYTNSKQHYYQSLYSCLFQPIIGAAVYIALEKFDEAISDCDRAIEINSKFVKVQSKVVKRIYFIGIFQKGSGVEGKA